MAYQNLHINDVGVGLRTQHLDYFATHHDKIAWLEIHPENFAVAGGYRLELLQEIRKYYPISCHCVGLSLGSSDGVDENHVKNLQKLYDSINPFVVSDHLSWSRFQGHYYNDLLPLPMTHDALDIFAKNVNYVQDKFAHKILIENPSLYMPLENNELSEAEFLAKLVEKTDCGLLLDVNNIYVSAHNLNYNAYEYLQDYPLEYIEEIHLAGHEIIEQNGETVLIDDHGSNVSDDVWALYRHVIEKTGVIKSLIEWDSDVPSPEILLNEARFAKDICKNLHKNTLNYAS